MCPNDFCQPAGHGHVAVCVVYSRTERVGITVLYTLIYAAIFGNGAVYSDLSVGYGGYAMGIQSVGSGLCRCVDWTIHRA